MVGLAPHLNNVFFKGFLIKIHSHICLGVNITTVVCRSRLSSSKLGPKAILLMGARNPGVFVGMSLSTKEQLLFECLFGGLVGVDICGQFLFCRKWPVWGLRAQTDGLPRSFKRDGGVFFFECLDLFQYSGKLIVRGCPFNHAFVWEAIGMS